MLQHAPDKHHYTDITSEVTNHAKVDASKDEQIPSRGGNRAYTK